MLTNILWFAGGVACTLACLFVAVCMWLGAWDDEFEAAERRRNLARLERDHYGR